MTGDAPVIRGQQLAAILLWTGVQLVIWAAMGAAVLELWRWAVAAWRWRRGRPV